MKEIDILIFSVRGILTPCVFAGTAYERNFKAVRAIRTQLKKWGKEQFRIHEKDLIKGDPEQNNEYIDRVVSDYQDLLEGSGYDINWYVQLLQ